MPEIPLPPAIPLSDVFSHKQTPEEFLQAIINEGFELLSTNESDGRHYLDVDGFFGYTSADGQFSAYFTTDGQFVSARVETSKYSTLRGIRVGDSWERLFELYGDVLVRNLGEAPYFIMDGVGHEFHLQSGYVWRWRMFDPILFRELQDALMAYIF
jgi:hypothetical protein